MHSQISASSKTGIRLSLRRIIGFEVNLTSILILGLCMHFIPKVKFY